MKRILLLALIALTAFNSCEKEKLENTIEEDVAIIEKYLNDNNINAVKDPSGVFVKIEEEGEGAEFPDDDSILAMYYEIKEMDGTVVTAFRISPTEQYYVNLPPGWQAGMTYFKKGSKGKIYIPGKLTYIERASSYGYGYGYTREVERPIWIIEVDLVNMF